MKIFLIVVCVLGALILLATFASSDWRTAPRQSAGIAPLPSQEPNAVVQVYAARAFSWRGWFATHTWIATKDTHADHYTTYMVTAWNKMRTGKSVVIADDVPDRYWFGAKPYLVEELRGAKAESAIPKIKAAADAYGYADTYRIWPGPNSNTFVSHVIRQVPELGVELPPDAIGKDWLPQGALFAPSETGTGYQISILGALGITVGRAEGLEFNILGLCFGFDFARPALKLPFIGRVGMKDVSSK